MRLSLQLTPISKAAVVPINYQYPLSAAIYKILRQASPDYAAFLHDKGYPAPSGRLMKLFTFGKLWIPQVRRERQFLKGGNGAWRLPVGSPMLDEFVQNFVLGLFESVEIVIAGQGVHAEFRVGQVEALPVPDFKESMRFRCLSPIVISTMLEHRGRLQPYYLRPHDEGVSEAIRNNLLQKHEIIHAQKSEDNQLTFRLEANDNPRSKLITIKEGTPEATQIKSFETYFTLEGSTELMQTAWECGLGERGSQGFGMIDLVKREE